MKRRRRIVSGEIMEFLDFSTVSPRPRKTLKGVGLRAQLFLTNPGAPYPIGAKITLDSTDRYDSKG